VLGVVAVLHQVLGVVACIVVLKTGGITNFRGGATSILEEANLPTKDACLKKTIIVTGVVSVLHNYVMKFFIIWFVRTVELT
jgi:hypothetical protein